MGCFVVPVAEAVITTAATKIIESKERKNLSVNIHTENEVKNYSKISFSTKLSWLSKLLWGGSFLLTFEHIWHGEIVPFFPFLTAISDPAEMMAMIQEMITVGGSMCLALTSVWAVMLAVTHNIEKKALLPKFTK